MTPTDRDRHHEDTIDLRQATEAVWRRRGPILAVTLAVAALALAIGFLMPDKYEASAQVLLTEPVMTTSIDPRIEWSPRVPVYRGVNSLAMAPGVLEEAMEAGVRQGLLPADSTLGAFAKRCSATMSGENLIRLTVTADDPEAAAFLCNAWAEQVAEHLDALFGIDRERLETTTEQLAEARANWEEAEENLLEVLPETRVAVREARLEEMRLALRSRVEKVHRIDLLVNEAKAVRRRLELVGDEGAEIDLGNMLSVIGLQGANAGALEELTIEISGEAALRGATTVGEARRALDHLIESLTEQQDQLREEADRMERAAGERAVELERFTHREAVATDLRDLARSAHEALGNQLEQVRMSLSDDTATAKVAGRAAPPAEPASASPLLFALLAAAVTFFLCALAAVALPPRRTEGVAAE